MGREPRVPEALLPATCSPKCCHCSSRRESPPLPGLAEASEQVPSQAGFYLTPESAHRGPEPQALLSLVPRRHEPASLGGQPPSERLSSPVRPPSTAAPAEPWVSGAPMSRMSIRSLSPEARGSLCLSSRHPDGTHGPPPRGAPAQLRADPRCLAALGHTQLLLCPEWLPLAQSRFLTSREGGK